MKRINYEVVHLIPNEKFTESYIRFVNSNYDPEDHLFFTFCKSNYRNTNYFNEISLSEISLSKRIKVFFWFVFATNRSSRLIIHGLFSFKIILFLFAQPWYWRKCYWVIWGGDLEVSAKTDTKSAKMKFKEAMKRVVARGFCGICTLVPNDYALARERFRVRGRYFRAIYPNPEANELIARINENRRDFESEKDLTRILIGNSAAAANNHIEVIDALKKFAGENIEVVCPLSYGDKDYARKIIDYGKHVFGSKFKYLELFINNNEYINFLSSVDVGIFNSNRQMALGNITSLLALGKKVYIRFGTSMWDRIVRELGLYAFDVENIKNESFQDFSFLDESMIKKNIDYYYNRDSTSYAKEVWSTIFFHKNNKKRK